MHCTCPQTLSPPLLTFLTGICHPHPNPPSTHLYIALFAPPPPNPFSAHYPPFPLHFNFITFHFLFLVQVVGFPSIFLSVLFCYIKVSKMKAQADELFSFVIVCWSLILDHMTCIGSKITDSHILVVHDARV